jgi:small subunit ribosomal protein S7
MRKFKPKPRTIPEDPIYKHKLVTKLINRSMRDGKKSVAQRQVYAALRAISEDKNEALKIFLAAIENIKPSMEVRPRRVGGAAYQVPMPVRGSRRESLAIRWLILAANARPNSYYNT